MPTYIGFSTQEVNQPRMIVQNNVDDGSGLVTQIRATGKKFRLIDEQLVIRDFINAFNIKQGDKVGQPNYGTSIWTYVFEPNTEVVRSELEDEVRRVATLDPRIVLNTINTYNFENGIMITIEMAVRPFNNPVQFGFLLDRQTTTAQYMIQSE